MTDKTKDLASEPPWIVAGSASIAPADLSAS